MIDNEKVEKILRARKKITIRGILFKPAQINVKPELQEALVIENRDKAISLYESCGNVNLGKLLVIESNKGGEYDPRIAKIARENLLEYLPKPINHVKQAALNAEHNYALSKIYRKSLV